jgi:mannose-1-phosphate guanylyltransferase/mannose-1-phosphate guanylyltransferase/phosphomannomutase
MQAVIVAGGKGTRLRPLTYARPKPMIPLFERPFLAWMVDRCRAVGVTDIIINLHYRAEQIEQYFRDGTGHGVKIRYSRESTPLDTAGAVKQAEPYFTGEPLLVFNADILTDLDLGALVRAHEARGATATIALTRVADPTAFGLVELDGADRVVAFREKPTAEEARRLGIDTVNAGTYVLDPGVFAPVPAGEPWSFERQLFPGLLAGGALVHGFVCDGYWLDLGNPERYWQAHRDILRGAMPFRLDAVERSQGVWIGDGAEVDPAAELHTPCYVGPSCRVGKDAVLPAGTVLCAASLVNRPLSPGIYPPGTLLP